MGLDQDKAEELCNQIKSETLREIEETGLTLKFYLPILQKLCLSDSEKTQVEALKILIALRGDNAAEKRDYNMRGSVILQVTNIDEMI